MVEEITLGLQKPQASNKVNKLNTVDSEAVHQNSGDLDILQFSEIFHLSDLDKSIRR